MRHQTADHNPEPPTIDVVLATNRDSPYLLSAVASLTAQSYPHWRLWIVDDGSPVPEHIDRIASDVPDAQVVRHSGQGVSLARNLGAKYGSGHFVAFLDDDDVWDPCKLQEQVVALVDHPDALGCFTGGRYIDEYGQVFGSGWNASPASIEELTSGQVPLPRIVTLVVRRAAWEKYGGFDPSYRVGEDNDFILTLAEQGPLVAVDKQLVQYRRHSANISSASGLEGRESARRLLKQHIERATRREDFTTAAHLNRNLRRQRKAWGAEGLRDLRYALQRRDFLAASRAGLWALRNAPLDTLRQLAVYLESRFHTA